MGTDDFFRARLDATIELKHPLAVLATRLPWAAIKAAVAPKLVPVKRVRSKDRLGAFDLEFGGCINPAGRPRLPIRLMSSLVYLNNNFNRPPQGGERGQSGRHRPVCGSRLSDEFYRCDYFMVYNFVRVRGFVEASPAIAVGVASLHRSMEENFAMADNVTFDSADRPTTGEPGSKGFVQRVPAQTVVAVGVLPQRTPKSVDCEVFCVSPML